MATSPAVTPRTSAPLLELRNVSKVFQSGIRKTATSTTVALRDASLIVPDGLPTSTAVAGESGSGKTTMARLLLGFIKPTSGQILYKGVDVATMDRTQTREYRREVQPIFQDPFEVYNPFYRVDHVLTTPLRNFGLASGPKDARRRMEEAMEMVGLRPKETLGRYPHELSGGQRQRIMVARALMLRPRIIMADEPVSMVDASLRATILDELRKLNTEFGISLVYVTHDLTTAYQVCDNIMVLYQGSVAEAGSVERVIRDPRHPYTQLLVSSIPQTDRTQRWGQDEIPLAEASLRRAVTGCRFAPRCVAVMEECWGAIPPLYRVDDDRAASCYLHKEAPVLPSEGIGQVFHRQASNPPVVTTPASPTGSTTPTT